MELEWDINKERQNIRKHRMDFSLAPRMVTDSHGLVIYDRYENNEHRYHLMSLVEDRCLVMIHTYPDENDENRIRIIGLRKATTHERKRYEAHLGEFRRSSRTH